MRPTTSASNLFRRGLCPGSGRMEEGLPDEETALSREGDLLHDYYHHPEYDRAIMLKPRQRDLVELAETLSQTVIERCEEQLENKQSFHEYRELQLQTREGFPGKPDRIRHYYHDKAILIIDPKFGYNLVERAEVNLQLRAYAVIGADFVTPGKFGPYDVFVSIVQPRMPWEERITIAKYTPEDIEAARKEIIYIVERSERDRAPLIAGEEQCRYCKAKLICPAFREVMGELSTLIPLDTDLSITKRADVIEKRLAEVTDEQLGKLLQALSLSKFVDNPAKDEARRRIEAGGLTDYTVAKDSEVREIANVQGAIARLILSGIMTKDRLLSIAEIPIGPIEEEYRKSTKCTWKEARDKINKVLANVIQIETRKGRIMRK